VPAALTALYETQKLDATKVTPREYFVFEESRLTQAAQALEAGGKIPEPFKSGSVTD
jgi:hypothetical protein